MWGLYAPPGPALAPSPHPSPRRGEGAGRVRWPARAKPLAPPLPACGRGYRIGVGILRCEAKPPPPPLPARGERSDSERSEGIRVRGRSREPELVDKPPHPICFASQGLRSQIDLSPQAGRGGASGARVAISKQRAIWIALPRAGREPAPDLIRGRIPSGAPESG